MGGGIEFNSDGSVTVNGLTLHRGNPAHRQLIEDLLSALSAVDALNPDAQGELAQQALINLMRKAEDSRRLTESEARSLLEGRRDDQSRGNG